MISLACSSVKASACIACGRVQRITTFSKSISSAHGRNLTRELDGVMKSTLSYSFDKTLLRSLLGFWSLRMGKRIVQTASAVEIQVVHLFNLSALLVRYHSKLSSVVERVSPWCLLDNCGRFYPTRLGQRSPCVTCVKINIFNSQILWFSDVTLVSVHCSVLKPSTSQSTYCWHDEPHTIMVIMCISTMTTRPYVLRHVDFCIGRKTVQLFTTFSESPGIIKSQDVSVL
jgi:hypothetical protein